MKGERGRRERREKEGLEGEERETWGRRGKGWVKERRKREWRSTWGKQGMKKGGKREECDEDEWKRGKEKRRK